MQLNLRVDVITFFGNTHFRIKKPINIDKLDVTSIRLEGLSSLVRIPALHAGGRGFKSHPLHSFEMMIIGSIPFNR